MRQKIGSAVFTLWAFFLAVGLTAQVNLPKDGAEGSAARLRQEGWQEVAPGVLQRQGLSGLETLAFGRDGLEQALQQLQHRFSTLRETYRTSPTPELEKALEHLRAQMMELEKTIAEQGADIPSTLPSGCNFNFGCGASASPLTSSQGVSASSNSYFYNTCSYQATVYSDAYGYTNTGNAFQANYPTGSNVSSSASISVPGGPSCFSDAYCYVDSSSLGLFYSYYASNSSCPVPAQPVDVTLYGPTHLYVAGYECSTAYYSASASGGTGSYSYSWSTDYGSGSGSSFSITFCGSNYNYTEYVAVSVTATDSASASDGVSMTTTVHYQVSGCEYYIGDRPFCYEPY